MFKNNRFLKILLPAAAVLVLLSACGSKSAQRHEVKHASAPSSKIDNHAPKNAKTSDGGTKTTNTNTPDLYTKQKHIPSVPDKVETVHVPSKQNAKQEVAQARETPAESPKANKAARKAGDDDSNLPSVDLGDGVVGHEDRGAGQIYIGFAMGDWQMEVHGNDVDSSPSATKDAAASLAHYLQNHALPVPHDHGVVQLDAENHQVTVRWQNDDKVASISGNASTVLNKICQ